MLRLHVDIHTLTHTKNVLCCTASLLNGILAYLFILGAHGPSCTLIRMNKLPTAETLFY